MADARERLVNHLSGMAGYNDKGFAWSGDAPPQVLLNQEQAQAVIMALVAEIGDVAFSASLLKQLKSGAGARDSSGMVAEQARKELLRTV